MQRINFNVSQTRRGSCPPTGYAYAHSMHDDLQRQVINNMIDIRQVYYHNVRGKIYVQNDHHRAWYTPSDDEVKDEVNDECPPQWRPASSTFTRCFTAILFRIPSCVIFPTCYNLSALNVQTNVCLFSGYGVVSLQLKRWKTIQVTKNLTKLYW